jgi:hypothetical protein
MSAAPITEAPAQKRKTPAATGASHGTKYKQDNAKSLANRKRNMRYIDSLVQLVVSHCDMGRAIK